MIEFECPCCGADCDDGTLMYYGGEFQDGCENCIKEIYEEYIKDPKNRVYEEWIKNVAIPEAINEEDYKDYFEDWVKDNFQNWVDENYSYYTLYQSHSWEEMDRGMDFDRYGEEI